MPTTDQPRPAAARATLTRDRVIETAIALADAEGIEALTMRRLGRELGVEAMALYNHVRHKEDLLDGMLDRVAVEIVLPAADEDWRVPARLRAISAHDVLMRHRWAASLWTSRPAPSPARLRYVDHALCGLREAGFRSTLLDRAYHTIENHIIGHALQALGFPLTGEEMADAGERFLASLPVESYPDLAAHVRYHITHPPGDDEFEFGLDLILEGLDRMRQAGQAARSEAPSRDCYP